MTSEDGEDRRGRPVRSRGPIILALEIGELVTLLVLAVSLWFAFHQIQASRQASAETTCYVLRALVEDAYRGRPDAQVILRDVGLSNCVAYARRARNSTQPQIPRTVTR